jgi:microcystin-dependent protein
MTPSSNLSRQGFLARLFATVTGGAPPAPASRAAETPQGLFPILGEIRLWAGYFEPTGWAFCQGQVLPIDQFDQLFSLIGTTYGGDGQVTFALPDLRGRVPVHVGAGYAQGELGGNESLFLSANQIPAHTHTMRASSSLGTSDTPTGRVLAKNAAGSPQYAAAADSDLATGAVTSSGGSQAHTNLQPYLGLNFIIALEGVYPQPS